MIPEFDENGHLPPGIHEATFDEIIKRFSLPKSRTRRSRTKSLQAFYSFIRPYAKEIYIDGSYTTRKSAPNDVDIVVFLRDGFSLTNKFRQRLLKFLSKKTHLQIIISVPGDKDSEDRAKWHVAYFQQNDRDFNPPVNKGIIRVR